MSATALQQEETYAPVTIARVARGPVRPRRPVKAAILYDQLESLLVANHRLGCLPLPVDAHGDWFVNSWRFDMLTDRREADRFLEDTSEARLVVLAIAEAQGMTTGPLAWLRRWAASRQSAEAELGVVLLGPASAPETELELFEPLRSLAEEQQLRLFRF